MVDKATGYNISQSRSFGSSLWPAYWVLVVVGFLCTMSYYEWHRGLFPITQCFKRLAPDVRRETIWRYVGQRCKPDERYWVRARYVFGGNAAPMEIIAYTDSNQDGIPDRFHHSSGEISGKSHLEFAETYVEPPTEARDLFLGVRTKPRQLLWYEKFKWTATPLEPVPFFRNSLSEPFRREKGARVSEILVQRVKGIQLVENGPKPGLAKVFLSIAAIILIIFIPLWRRLGKTQPGVFLYLIALVAFIHWRLLAAIAPTPHRWSGFYFQRLPGFLSWIIYGVTILLISPGILATVKRRADLLVRWIYHRLKKAPGWLWSWILAIAMISLFYWLRSNEVYGDAYAPLSMGYEYHNPMAVAIYQVFRNYCGITPKFFDMNVISYFSILWGAVYVLAATGLANQLGKTHRQRYLLLALFLTPPAMQIFFGYIEVYAISLAFVMVFLYTAIRFLSKGGSVILPSVMAFLAYIVHLSAALLLPMVVLLWIVMARRLQWRILPILKELALTIFFAIFLWAQCLFMLNELKYKFDLNEYLTRVPQGGLALLKGSTGHPLGFVFLPLKNITYPHHYAFFTKEHASQLFSEWMFLSPIATLLMFGAFIRYPRSTVRQQPVLALILVGLPCFISSWWLSPMYAYPKDWDLFSLHSILITVAAGTIIMRIVPRPNRDYYLSSLLVMQVTALVPWVLYNHFIGVPLYERFFALV